MVMPKTTNIPKEHHFIRTITASILGVIAVFLILSSVLTVWLNRTLTDTDTYMSSIAPLVTKPEVQDLIVEKTTDTLFKEQQDVSDLAIKVLPAEQVVGKTPQQLNDMARQIVETSIRQVISSPEFAKQWEETNRAAHESLIKQLESDSSEITLDLSPLVADVVERLKTTSLAPVVSEIEIKPDSAKLNLKGGSIDQARDYYDSFQKGVLGVVLAAIAAVAGAILVSTHHLKTLRRILLVTGVVSLLMALLTRAPSIVKVNGTRDSIEQKAAVVIADTLFHNFQVACIVIGVVCIGAAIGSKVYDMWRTKKA